MKSLIAMMFLATASPSFAAGKEITATVNGMVCGFCAQGIMKKLKAEPAVDKIDVTLESKTVKVSLKEGKDFEDKAFEKLLKDSGYTVEKITRN